MHTNNNINAFLDGQPYAETTKAQYRWVLERFVTAHPSSENISADELRQWLSGNGWGNAMTWQAFCASRSYLKWCNPAHPALSLKIRREESKPQMAITKGQARIIMESFDNSPKGIRDRAIAAVLLDTGLREFEICRLMLRQVHPKEGFGFARIKGGSTARFIFSSTTGQFISDWLHIRNDVRDHSPALFISLGGIRPGTALTPRGLQAITIGWGRACNISGRLTPHRFRRAFAVLATYAGAPSRLVQIAGRWSSIEMVELYTRDIDLEAFRAYSPLEHVLDS
jgi:integrase